MISADEFATTLLIQSIYKDLYCRGRNGIEAHERKTKRVAWVNLLKGEGDICNFGGSIFKGSLS